MRAVDLPSKWKTLKTSRVSRPRDELADHLTDPDWLTRLAYLSCIFDRLNGLNMSLCENTSIMLLNDKIRAFKRKVDRWTAQVEMGRIDYVS